MKPQLGNNMVPPAPTRFLKLKPWLRRGLRGLAVLVGLLLMSYCLLPKPALLPEGITFSRQVMDAEQNALFVTTTADGKLRLPAQLDQINETLVQATLEMEDRRFYTHCGVDFKSVCRAVWGMVSRKKLGGGSTITMQLARLRWGLQTRSLSGKLWQMIRAVQLERHFSKQQILEAYFTLAPYGGNVEGVLAASFRWCGKPAKALSLREAASLSAIPQSPSTRTPKLTGNTALATAQARLMTRLRAARGEPANELDAEFHLKPHAVPREAPHYARRLLRLHSGGNIPSSIHKAKQTATSLAIREFLDRFYSQGLRNAAAIVLHAPTREIHASVGSADFFDAANSGQVDGTHAKRSPGSTLKPFIYALALDKGLIQPQTLLDDAPRRFSGYNPENSDHHFLGPVPAAEALRLSRNVPAVELAHRVPEGGLEAFLRSSGVALPRKDSGLALAIGATEISLTDLANLYAELASPRQKLLSPSACWLTLRALESEEPAAPSGLVWKTGTSNGFRDTWACGVQGEWVICVWVGHFDGRAMPGLFARETAAPLLWQVAHKLKLTTLPTEQPPEVTKVDVCRVSGDLVGKHCPAGKAGWFIGGVSPITTCRVHQLVHEQVAEIWPADRLEQFRRAGFPRTRAVKLPSELASPAMTGHSTPPRILSPQPSITYYIRHASPEQNRLWLQANAGADVRQIHWFAENKYLGASTPAEPLPWLPEAGDFELEAMDDAGRVSSVSISVRRADQ